MNAAPTPLIGSAPTVAPHGAATPATGSDPALVVAGLHRHYGSGDRLVRAVDGIDLTVMPGEVVALLGPNGAGKTTTLDMLLGLVAPTSGSVRVLGEAPARAAASGRIAAVLQTGGLLGDLTVGETVRVIASLHGRDALARVPDTMARADLTDLAGRRVSKCSGGEQQRIKFALALVADPDVLVLDEPTSGMDVTARRRFWDTLRADADAGRTVLFATHYLEEAEQFAARTVVLHHGRIVADGPTARLRASLGAHVVSATLPHVGRDALVRAVSALPGSEQARVEGDRLTLHTKTADAAASTLLQAGAHDLLITAPTLETAFSALTED